MLDNKLNTDGLGGIFMPMKTQILIACSVVLFMGHTALAQTGDELRGLVISELEQSRLKVHVGYIEWRRETYDNGFTYTDLVETESVHKQWWIGEKVATRSFGDRVYLRSDEDPGSYFVLQGGSNTAFDGEIFYATDDEPSPSRIGLADEPNYASDQNWFIIAGLDWVRSLPDYEAQLSSVDSVETSWAIVQEGNTHLIHFTVQSDSGESATTKFSPEQGYYPIERVMHSSTGELISRTVYEISEVSEGVRFPTRVEQKYFDKGELSLHQTFELDLETIRLNDRSAIPEEGFELPIEPGMVIHDERGGVELRYDYGSTPLSKEEIAAILDGTGEIPQTPLPSSNVLGEEIEAQPISQVVNTILEEPRSARILFTVSILLIICALLGITTSLVRRRSGARPKDTP